MRDIIREEFASFREEIVRMFRADLNGISAEMQELSGRVTDLESRNSSATSSNLDHEELVDEILERERRSSNLIFYNFEELNSPSADDASGDLAMAEEIIRKIRPLDPPHIRIQRLGDFRQGHTRLLQVSVPSKSDAIDILNKKNIYSGPVGIRQDLTKRQRDHFLGVNKQLENLKNSDNIYESISTQEKEANKENIEQLYENQFSHACVLQNLKERILWTTESTLALINLIAEHEKQFQNLFKKNVWRKIAKTLNEKLKFGTSFTWQKCDTKWKSLLRKYKDVKKHNATAWKNDQIRWEYFEIMNKILHDKPDIIPIATHTYSCNSNLGLVIHEELGNTDKSTSEAINIDENNSIFDYQFKELMRTHLMFGFHCKEFPRMPLRMPKVRNIKSDHHIGQVVKPLSAARFFEV